jgi:hypothetical protein
LKEISALVLLWSLAMNFETRFSVSADDYAGFLVHLGSVIYRRERSERSARSFWQSLLIWVVIGLAFMLTFGALSGNDWKSVFLLGFVIGAAVAAVLFSLSLKRLQRRMVLRTVKKTPNLLSAHVHLRGDVIKWNAGGATVFTPLKSVERVLDFKEGLVVCMAISGLWIPSAAFRDKEERKDVLLHLLQHMTPEAQARSIKE